MGAGQSGGSARTVTIDNVNPVVDISDSVVQRLKGQLRGIKNVATTNTLSIHTHTRTYLTLFKKCNKKCFVMQHDDDTEQNRNGQMNKITTTNHQK